MTMNMKQLIYKTATVIIAVITLFTACTSSFDDMNTNPDATTEVRSSMLATKVILDMVKEANYWENEFLVKRMFWGEQINDYQYNRLPKGSFSVLKNLTNAEKMVELAPEGSEDAYTGLYYFLKGRAFYRATMDMGEIPYSEALNIEEYKTPKYDSQKDVFLGVLADLAKAEEYFARATGSFEGDPFYNGDTDKWRKATNVLRLKVLMALQKRADDTAELKVKETFAQIVSGGNIFKSNEDNLQLTYSDKDRQKNPYHNSDTKAIEVYAGTSMIIDPLKEYGDYRLFSYFAPAQALTDPLYVAEGKDPLEPGDWDAYTGLDVAGVFNTELVKIASRMHNRPNDIYRLSYVGVPCISLGYADMNFLLAEAAERGWISGSAQQYYETGIRASFEFVRQTVPTEYNNGRDITDEYITSYLKGEKVAYKTGSTQTDRLKQIWMQAYLAGFYHMNKDAFYDYRRTGYPEWPVNPATNLNPDNTRIPVRYMYPTSELNYNKENLLEALDRQWGGTDDINNVMWVIK